MRIGIIGPSRMKEFYNLRKVAETIAFLKHEIVVVPENGSSSEFFASEYLNSGGRKVYSIIPLDDKEFGYAFLNLDLGEIINCGTWRNQPEKLNEECDAIICVGYSAGVLAEIAYSKWFPKGKAKKPIYIIQEFVSGKLPTDIEVDIRYISINEVGSVLK